MAVWRESCLLCLCLLASAPLACDCARVNIQEKGETEAHFEVAGTAANAKDFSQQSADDLEDARMKIVPKEVAKAIEATKAQHKRIDAVLTVGKEPENQEANDNGKNAEEQDPAVDASEEEQSDGKPSANKEVKAAVRKAKNEEAMWHPRNVAKNARWMEAAQNPDLHADGSPSDAEADDTEFIELAHMFPTLDADLVRAIASEFPTPMGALDALLALATSSSESSEPLPPPRALPLEEMDKFPSLTDADGWQVVPAFERDPNEELGSAWRDRAQDAASMAPPKSASSSTFIPTVLRSGPGRDATVPDVSDPETDYELRHRLGQQKARNRKQFGRSGSRIADSANQGDVASNDARSEDDEDYETNMIEELPMTVNVGPVHDGRTTFEPLIVFPSTTIEEIEQMLAHRGYYWYEYKLMFEDSESKKTFNDLSSRSFLRASIAELGITEGKPGFLMAGLMRGGAPDDLKPRETRFQYLTRTAPPNRMSATAAVLSSSMPQQD